MPGRRSCVGQGTGRREVGGCRRAGIGGRRRSTPRPCATSGCRQASAPVACFFLHSRGRAEASSVAGGCPVSALVGRCAPAPRCLIDARASACRLALPGGERSGDVGGAHGAKGPGPMRPAATACPSTEDRAGMRIGWRTVRSRLRHRTVRRCFAPSRAPHDWAIRPKSEGLLKFGREQSPPEHTGCHGLLVRTGLRALAPGQAGGAVADLTERRLPCAWEPAPPSSEA